MDLRRRDFCKTCLLLGLVGLTFPTAGRSTERAKRASPGTSASSGFEPGYLALHRNNELKRRGEELWTMMENCELCPRACGVNRVAGEKGFCGASAKLFVASHHPHFGEERCLVGRRGSGTIFFTHCSLRCVFCINWEISQGGWGAETEIEHLAGMMLDLQKRGCHNINVVTPTHYPAHIVLALDRAAEKGLRLPVVYNTCGWERLPILQKLDGIVDIYLPDFKYADSEMAAQYSSGADSYPEVAKAALLEMHRQVGVAKKKADGLLYRGMIIRHLVMPNNVGGTRDVLFWIAGNLPKDTYVNLMSQYRPMYKAFHYPAISRRLTRQEFAQAITWAKQFGLTNVDIQKFPF